MSEPTRELLDRIVDRTGLQDHDRALQATRSVLSALIVRRSSARLEDLAELLPEELETIWKPAYYDGLRVQSGVEVEEEAAPSEGPTFEDEVSERLPEMSREEAEALARAVVDAVGDTVPAERRPRWERLVPSHLREGT